MESSQSTGALVHKPIARTTEWLAAPWAATCGVLAGIGLDWSLSRAGRWLITVVLAEIVVALIWDVAIEVDWVALARDWAASPPGDTSVPHVPYLARQAPGHRLGILWRRFRFWFGHTLWPSGGRAIATLLLLAPALLLVAGMFSAAALWVTMACLAYVGAGAVVAARSGRRLPVAPLALAGAWLLGQAAVTGLSWAGVGAALLAALAFVGLEAAELDWRPGLAMAEAAVLALAVLLVSLHSALPAALVGLLLVCGRAVRAGADQTAAASRLMRPLALFSLLVAALAIGNR